jgi:predicted  nucleic acid-binding Zn-ribbon protein
MHVMRGCAQCGELFEAGRRDARFCSPQCRKKSWKGVPSVPVPAELPGPVTRATRAELAKLGVDTADDVAKAALSCASALDNPGTPPGALVGLSRVLPESLDYLRWMSEVDA